MNMREIRKELEQLKKSKRIKIDRISVFERINRMEGIFESEDYKQYSKARNDGNSLEAEKILKRIPDSLKEDFLKGFDFEHNYIKNMPGCPCNVSQEKTD